MLVPAQRFDLDRQGITLVQTWCLAGLLNLPSHVVVSLFENCVGEVIFDCLDQIVTAGADGAFAEAGKLNALAFEFWMFGKSLNDLRGSFSL